MTTENNFGCLIDLWQKDKENLKRKGGKRAEKETSKDEESEKVARKSISLISKGFISKASNRMLSKGVASMESKETQLAMKAKFPKTKVDAQGAGLGSDDGSTRQEVIRQLEELRGAVILEGIKANGMGKRQVQSMINRDKLTTAWLQALPGPEGLSNAAFSEAMSLVLCLPSPICRSRVGEKVGKRTVDIYGDSIQNEHLPGDDWRHRHDKIKMTISSLCKWARLPIVTEVFGLFSHLIPAQALNRMEAGQKRQGMVPDFRMTIPTPMGGNQLCLAELKVIACSQTRYPARGNT